jgi:hypothetical protein
MENIDITFLTNLGWQKYAGNSDAPENCFYKKPYPVALWWDDTQNGFWVIYLNELTSNPILIGRDFIKTENDYDRLIMPILKVIQESQREK